MCYKFCFYMLIALVGIKVRLGSSMVRRGALGGRHDTADDIYEVARNSQLKAGFQWMEESFDALSKQLATLTIVNQPKRRHPNPCFMEEDDFDVEEDDEHIERVL